MGRGRPRKTDPDEVLDTAMKLFWDKGFEGTSMNDLVCATGMAKPGLYACFGDKESLYKKSLTRYFDGMGSPLMDDLLKSEDSLKISLRRFLTNVANSMVENCNPSGCFVVNSLIEGSSQHPELEALGRKFDKARRDAFIALFERAQEKGELSTNIEARPLAEFFAAQSLALGVLGRSGADQQRLDSFVEVAMDLLPE